MLIDLQREALPAHIEADLIIVGAGALGLTMAVQSARRGRRVLLLEAGGLGVTSESQSFLLSARSVGHPLGGLHQGRFRALGGSTTFWGGQLTPLDPLTYQHRPWISDFSWPIGHAEVAPYYERLFALLGMARQIGDDAEVWRRVGVEPPRSTEELEFFFTRWVPESDFSRLFAEDIRRESRLTCVINAPVTALAMDPAGSRITGVRVGAEAGSNRLLQAPVVVLASGTIETARLLLCPLADGREAPWGSNPWLGRGYMDHIECLAGSVTPLDAHRFHRTFDNIILDRIKYHPKIRLSERAQAQRQLFSVVAYLFFNSALSEHLANAKIFVRGIMRGRLDLSLFRHPGQLWTLLRLMAPMVRSYLRDHRIHAIADRGTELVLCSEQRPLAQSAVTLRSERDALGMPMIDVDWRIDGVELETLATFGELVRDHLEQQGLARVALAPALVARDPAFLSKAHDTYHQMGTTRMASDPGRGVVDADLRVHGTQNLYVAGAAVFPTTGFQNCTFTAMALGLRLVDHLAAMA